MNSVVRQLHEQGTDIVMVDTGNSYEGLCEYLGGKYISYTEERPITMNPFRIHKEEMNVEKTGFLKNLVLLIWKGTQGTVTKTEDRLVENVITDYYDAYFNGFDGFTPMQREDLRKSLAIDERNRDGNREESEQERNSRIECMIDEMERRRKELKVERIEKIAISAMKQSLKAVLPRIDEMIPFENYVREPFDGQKFIAHCYKDEERKLLSQTYKAGASARILIGPEGDFSPEEVKLAIENGYIPISLGASRLRTETAGVVACHTLHTVNEIAGLE